MEHLWSQAGATGSSRRNFNALPGMRMTCKQLLPVATGCGGERLVIRTTASLLPYFLRVSWPIDEFPWLIVPARQDAGTL